MHEPATSTGTEPHCPTDKEYVDLVHFNVEVGREYIEETGQPAKISYYCRECKQTVTPTRIAKRLVFKCSVCNKEPISFGTESSIASFYNIK